MRRRSLFNAVSLARLIAATGGTTLLANAALGGGLYIGEFGQPNMGASRAGAQALAEDAATAWQNPAGIAFLEQKKTMVTALVVNSETEFDQELPASSLPPAVANAAGNRPASNGGDAGDTAVGGWSRRCEIQRGVYLPTNHPHVCDPGAQ